jgi:hypothetical protein
MKRPCSFCESSKRECRFSSADSSSCYECVRHHKSHCDAQGVSLQQLRRITDQHDRFEAEMERVAKERSEMYARFAEQAAEMDAKVERLHLQKRMWAEKLARAISCGVDTVEELEELERQEAEEAERQEAEETERAAAQAVVPPTTDPVPDASLLDPSWIQSSSFVDFPAEFDWSSTPPLVDPGSSGGTPGVSRGS